jgi:hypothetical protein
LLVAEGNSLFEYSLTTTPGSTLRVTGANANTLTVPHTLINNGAIELTSIGFAPTTLAVTHGSLINMPGATIATLPTPGTGGDRRLDVELDNRGTLTTGYNPYSFNYLENALTVHHSNSGTIQANGSLYVALRAGSTFANSGTLDLQQANQIITIDGDGNHGTFYWDAGTTMIGPAGYLNLYETNVSFRGEVSTSPDFGGVILVGSIVSGPGTLINSSGALLALEQGSIINSPVVNRGGLGVLDGTINGPLTTAAGSAISVAHADYNSGTLTVANGFTNNGTIQLTSYNDGPAELAVTNGVLVNAVGATIESRAGVGGTRALHATLDNHGTITINVGTTVMGDVTNDGTLIISAGSPLTVAGDYTQTHSGVLRLTGLYPGESALLQVSGAATLDGTLDVTIATIDGGDRFRVLTFGSRSGAFTTLTYPEFGPGMVLDPQYDDTGLTLVILLT